MEVYPKKDSLTIDGIHPSLEVTDGMIQLLLSNINSKKDRVRHTIRPDNLGLFQNVNAPAPSKFVGRYPVLGLMVGVYIFAVLITGDIFLITHFLMTITHKEVRVF